MVMWRGDSWGALERGEATDPRWPDYAEYARLRSQGLRQAALDAADRCADRLRMGDETIRWAFSEWLCATVLSPRTTRTMVLPHSLEGLVTETLWRAHNRGETTATAWLVQWFPVEVTASLDYVTDALGEFLRHAVAVSPEDDPLRELLAEHLVAWVRTDVADLANGRYDGDPTADLDRLAEAESLLTADNPLLDDIAHLRDTVETWRSRGE